MYALRQPSSFEFGKYGAVVFPSHEDAFNYELLNSLGDNHEAQLRRVCEPHVRQALIAVTVGNRVIPPHIMIHGEHHVLAFIEEFIEEIGVMTPIGSFLGEIAPPAERAQLCVCAPQKQHVCVTVSTKLAQLWVDRVCLRGVRGYGITVITVHQRS